MHAFLIGCHFWQQTQADLATLDGVIHELYAVISGPAGQKRDWDRFRALFSPGARLVATSVKEDGTLRRTPISPEDYIRLSGPYLEKNGFFEKEIARKVERWESLAQVFTTYESRHLAGDKDPFERGINSLQLTFDGKRWWVESLVWLGEGPKAKLTKEFLPQ